MRKIYKIIVRVGVGVVVVVLAVIIVGVVVKKEREFFRILLRSSQKITGCILIFHNFSKNRFFLISTDNNRFFHDFF